MLPLIELYDRKWNGSGCFRLEISHKSGQEGINEHDPLFFLRKKKSSCAPLLGPVRLLIFERLPPCELI